MINTDVKTKKLYIRQVKKRYQNATKQEKKFILDEVTKTTGYGRKHAIAVLRGSYQYKQGKIVRLRRRRYDMLDAIVLAKVCELLDWINSKRVQPEIGVAIDSLVLAEELVCSKEQRKKTNQDFSGNNRPIVKRT